MRRRRRNVALPCAGLAACALVAVHSIVDFSLQTPAVAASFALLLGVALAQSRPAGATAHRASADTGTASTPS